MTITAKIIADSISADGVRLTTLQLRYPRFIHAEELTHRVLETGPEIVVPDGLMYDQNLSRNASSSRAVPVERLIQDVLRDTAMPIHWGKNQPGMQAREEHDALVPVKINGFDPRVQMMSSKEAWLEARDAAIRFARAFAEAGYHKQIVNRLLEPFAHINVVVTATDWDNFFALRLHPDAQPEIHELARVMKEAMDASEPQRIDAFGWHLPYITWEDEDVMLGNFREMRLVSAARCARVSYLTHEGKKTRVHDDLLLAQGLLADKHMSPFEHQATPAAGRHANFSGWRQYRTEIEHVG